MYYKNIITRFLLRKNFFRRVKMRLGHETRKLLKNEFDDMLFLFQRLNKMPEVIFDCGANIGFVTYQFNKTFPNAKVYAFEPNPSVFETLQKSASANPKNSLNNVGIGNENGTLNFYKNNNTGTSSFLRPNDFHSTNMAKKYVQIDIPVITIGEFCRSKGVDKINLLKLDVEGFELKALQGCEDMLKAQKIDFIYAEVNFIPAYDGQCLIEDVLGYLRKLNYIPYNFYGINETRMKESVITNLLFISNDIAKELCVKNGKNSVYTNAEPMSVS